MRCVDSLLVLYVLQQRVNSEPYYAGSTLASESIRLSQNLGKNIGPLLFVLPRRGGIIGGLHIDGNCWLSSVYEARPFSSRFRLTPSGDGRSLRQ